MEWIIYSSSDLNFYTKPRYYLEERKTQNFTAAIVLSTVQCPVKDWNHIPESIEVCWERTECASHWFAGPHSDTWIDSWHSQLEIQPVFRWIHRRIIMRIVISNGKSISWVDAFMVFAKHIGAYGDSLQLASAGIQRPRVRYCIHINRSEITF